VTAVDPLSLPLSSIRGALVAGASGLYREEGAVGLLIAHDVWPRRGDFLRACVEVDDDGWTRDGVATLASVDWDAARLLAGSVPASGEVAVLHVAVAIAVDDLGGQVTSLDAGNLALLLDALAHTAGWHERGITHQVTAVIGARPGHAAAGGAR